LKNTSVNEIRAYPIVTLMVKDNPTQGPPLETGLALHY